MNANFKDNTSKSAHEIISNEEHLMKTGQTTSLQPCVLEGKSYQFSYPLVKVRIHATK